MSRGPLHLPAGARFECTGCGRCCRAAWTVAVEPDCVPVIEGSNAFRDQTRDGYRPLRVEHSRVVIAKGLGNRCTFLDPAEQCLLHAELGGDKKPLVCQTYPFLFTNTPDGMFVALSYACPAVLAGLGSTLEEQRGELESLLDRELDDVPHAELEADRLELSEGRALAWDDYLSLEKALLEAFDARRPVESLLGMAVHLLSSAASPQPSLPSALELAKSYELGGFDRELATMVSCNLIAMTEDVADPEERARLGNFLWNGGIHRSTKFALELPAFSLSKPADEMTAHLMERYVRNAIEGKRLLSGTVVSRLLALTCGVAIMLFYTRAFQRAQDETHFSFDAVDRAFTLVESELLSHTRSFDGFFAEFERALASILNALKEER